MPDAGATPIAQESSTRGVADALQELRRRSKLLFGNADRLQVAAAVADAPSGVVHAQELSTALGISPSRVRAQLLAMADAGVVRVLGRGLGRTVDYERIDGPYWEAIRLLMGHWGKPWNAHRPA